MRRFQKHMVVRTSVSEAKIMLFAITRTRPKYGFRMGGVHLFEIFMCRSCNLEREALERDLRTRFGVRKRSPKSVFKGCMMVLETDANFDAEWRDPEFLDILGPLEPLAAGGWVAPSEMPDSRYQRREIRCQEMSNVRTLSSSAWHASSPSQARGTVADFIYYYHNLRVADVFPRVCGCAQCDMYTLFACA